MHRIVFLVIACIPIILLPARGTAGDGPSGFLTEYLGQLDYVEGQILALEGAVPQEKMAWRPAEGVRSISEAYMHIAFANYLLMNFAGFPPPPEIAPMMDPAKGETWDSMTSDKEEVAAKIKASFASMKSALSGLSEKDIEAPVEFFGRKTTKRDVLLSALSHMHEHLGQSIAYARMNGIVPPWTAAGEN
jgi:uncharacterized damage-inducible protein DinB